MCVECYLSTDRDIPDIPFDEHDPKFNLQKIDERPLPCLTQRFAYHCGSNTGCGCAFGKLDMTEELLQQTERELLAGTLSEQTGERWWDNLLPPPKNLDEFYEQAEEIRMSRNDTLALYDLIVDTWKNGYACEVLIFWSGDQNCPMTTQDIDLRHTPTAIDFDIFHGKHGSVGDIVLLYRFPRT